MQHIDETCIFCKLANGIIPTDMVYEDEQLAAFKDAAPLAPVHILIVPKEHKTNLNDYTEADQALLGHILLVAKKIAKEQGLEKSGYRIVTNVGADAGQSVFHTHFHILGGRKLTFNKQ